MYSRPISTNVEEEEEGDGATVDDYMVYEEEKMTEAKQHRWLKHKKRHVPLNQVCDVDRYTGKYYTRPRTQREIEAEEQEQLRDIIDDDDEIALSNHPTEEADASLISSYWYDAWDPIIDNYNNRHEEWLKTKLIRSRTEVARDKVRDISVSLGDKRVAMIHKTLDSYGTTKRAVHQRLFHDKFLISCLPRIYGDEWQWSRVRVLEKHGLTKIDHETMVITPRRFGKTWAVTMFVAAVLLCCAGILISVLSTGARASTSLKETTVKFIEKSTCHHGKDRILRSGKELLQLVTEQELNANGGGGGDSASRKKGIKANSTKDTIATLLCFPSSSIGKSLLHQHTHAHAHAER